MTVHVRLFSVVRERAGLSELHLELPAGATVGSAAAKLTQRYPAIGELASRVEYAVNQSYAQPAILLKDGDELALIPPVSGG
jgi:molybdopterin converting factor subunit 1